jgi:hypothetical protein
MAMVELPAVARRLEDALACAPIAGADSLELH